jgi:UDP-GlcNAc:undecaprenyl-phosphate/decaprenyl-phosphate GlcNAc-1-phosphate transferase
VSLELRLLIVFGTALGVAALATPIAGRFARIVGAVDRPNDRSVNRRADIPLLGGLAVALGVFVGLSAAVMGMEAPHAKGHIEAYLVGGSLLLAMGVVDDRYGLRAVPKLFIQIAVAVVAILYGFRIDHVTDPVTLDSWMLPEWLVWTVTTLWIVGVTNAMNLIDGLDGLCSGVGAIIAVTLSYVAWQGGLADGAAVGVALVGALVGFLLYNFPPASIFLGDTGALFIGYCLSLIALEGYQKVTLLTFIVPLLALAVPIMDTTLSVIRRITRRANPLAPDRLHMHHRLLESEGSDRAAVLSIWFLTSCFCVISVSFTRLEGYAAILFLVAVAILTLRMLRNLGFFDNGDRARTAEGGAAESDSARAPGESR